MGTLGLQDQQRAARSPCSPAPAAGLGKAPLCSEADVMLDLIWVISCELPAWLAIPCIIHTMRSAAWLDGVCDTGMLEAGQAHGQAVPGRHL